MKKVLGSPEVVAAIFTVIGTLLVGIILAFVEGRIGFEPLVTLFAIILLALLLYVLYRRAGQKVTVGAAAAMVVIGFVTFFAYRAIREQAKATPTAVVEVSAATETVPPAATTGGVTPSSDEAVVEAQPSSTPDLDVAPSLSAPSVTSSAPTGLAPPIGLWQPILDLPREIISVAVNPDNPRVVYAGATGFVYRSDDAGATWSSVSTGLPNEDVVALAHTSSTEPPILYAIIGSRNEVLTSEDGGVNWTRLGNVGALMGGFEKRLYIAPSSQQPLYFLSVASGLMYSPNGGSTWLPVGEGLPGYEEEGRGGVLTLEIHPTDPSIIYAGTGGFVGQGHGVYKSVDGGQTWMPSNRGMLDYRITALAIDPAGPQIVYAGGDSGDFFKSTDGGDTWTKLSEALKVQEYSAPRTIHVISIDPQNPNRVFLLGGNSGLMFSEDGGQKWQMLGKPGEHDQPYFGIAEMFLAPRLVVIAGLEHNVVWRYADGEE